MSEMQLPKSDEEEADFWDRVDTTQILDDGEEIELGYEPETAIENICIHCGKKMIERKRDNDVPNWMSMLTNEIRKEGRRVGMA